MVTTKEEAQQKQVELLLARKRLELPGEDYFASVLPEFHRRQRMMLAQPRSRFAVWMSDLYEAYIAPVSPSVRYATAVAVAVLGLGLGLTQSWNDSGNVSLTLGNKNQASHNAYAFSQAMEETTASKFDQQLDAAAMNKTGSVNGALPHYVLASAPTSYDSNLAF